MDDEVVDLERLVLEPEETLEVEYKEWLNLRSNPHKAKLAKELIALANHGGGQIVLGFSDPDLERLERPDDYEYVDTDYINGAIVAKYAEPPFHCSVSDVGGHIVISVPAGATIPIRSKKGSQDDEIVENRYYIRRPGPNSETPQSGLEWDSLLRRCISNRDVELEETVKRVVRIMLKEEEEPSKPAADAIESLLND